MNVLKNKHTRILFALVAVSVILYVFYFLNENIDTVKAEVITASFTVSASTTWTVPEGVTSVEVYAWGAGGAGGGGGTSGAGGAGGGGGFASGTISVTGGESLNLRIGGTGSPGATIVNSGSGGGSGGYTGILRGGDVLILASGGGGGGGGDNSSATAGGAGGAGGGTTGTAGGTSLSAGGGGGGTSGAGGVGGSGGGNSGTAGSSLAGGEGADGRSAAGVDGSGPAGGSVGGAAGGTEVNRGFAGGGGGGGGYYGGGGGSGSLTGNAGGGGGGGGSSFATSSATATTIESGSGAVPGNDGGALHNGTAGDGGSGGAANNSGTAGIDGQIVLRYISPATTWNALDWTKRVGITIDADNIDSALTDFPVYVNLADMPDLFWSSVRSDCGDIRIMNSALTVEMPREIVSCSVGSKTGELHFKANSISSSADTTFYIYYGNTGDYPYENDHTYGAENVWTSDYVAVWHLGEGDDTSTGFYKDSTSNGYDGTLTDADGDTATSTGVLGGGLHLNGDADFVDIALNATELGINGATDRSISAWTYTDTYTDAGPFSMGSRSDAQDFSLRMVAATTYRAQFWGGSDLDFAYTSVGNWVNFILDYDGTTATAYANGTSVASKNVSLNTTDTYDLRLGTWHTSPFLDGILDEVRVSDVVRSTSWISAEYTNQSDTSSFYTIIVDDTAPAPDPMTFAMSPDNDELFVVPTASYVDSFSIVSEDGGGVGLAFSSDGYKMFVLGDAGDDVNEYTLSTAFDVSTASFVDSFSVAAQETNPVGLAFSADGTKMFISGFANDSVNEYSLLQGAKISMVATTAADDNTVEYYFSAVTGSCGSDIGTGGTDSGWQSGISYADVGIQNNKCYAYTVTARDSLGNYGATSTASSTYSAAATPGVLSFSNVTDDTVDLTNDANGNSSTNPVTTFAVLVSTTSPADATWDAKYVDASGDPSASAVWLTDAQIDALTVSGLNEVTQYTFQAKARNDDGDETPFGAIASTTTLDGTPPTPSPITFSTPPADASVSSVSMTATTATDDSAVEYYFSAVTGSCGSDIGTGGTDSGWQSSAAYTDTGLQTNQCYAYTATARDSTGNYGATSTASSVYTTAATPGTPVIVSQTNSTITITNTENGNPASNPATAFALIVSNSAPTDATWNGKYVDASGDPSVSAVWLTDAQLDNLVITGLTDFTEYTLKTKARNGDGDETPFGASTSESTLIIENSRKIRLQGGTKLNSGVILQ